MLLSLTSTLLGLLMFPIYGYELPLCHNGRLQPHWVLPKRVGWHEDYQLYNSDRSPNVFCSNGTIIMEVRRSNYVSGVAYSSGMLVRREPFGYGTLKVTAQLPKGKGLFPSISLLPYDSMFSSLRDCAYPMDGACLWPTNGQITFASTVNDHGFLPFIQNLHFGLPGTPSYPLAPDDRRVLDGMADDWWDRFHVWELRRTSGAIVMAVDGVETFYATSHDLTHFLDETEDLDDKLDVYNDVPMAPFDDSNPMQLVIKIAVGGRTPCSECQCCPVERRYPLLNTTINDRPYSTLIITAIEFEPLEHDHHVVLVLFFMSLPLMALGAVQLHIWPSLLRFMCTRPPVENPEEGIQLTRAASYGSIVVPYQSRVPC